jgi:hypothetical protein
MRTTLDIPDTLLKRAKIAAVERGVTLRQLVGAALARELETESGGAKSGPSGVQFPIFPSQQPESLALTNAEIARDEEAEDARRHGLSR